MPTAQVTGTLPTPPAGVVSSTVTIVETLEDGTVLAPAAYTLIVPLLTFTFSAGVNSVLNASQVDTNAAGSGPATVTPPFTVTPPLPPLPLAPAGPIQFTVDAVNP